MKLPKNYIFPFILFLIISISCNSVDGDPDPVPDPLDDQASLLNGTWILKDASSATKDGNVVSDFESITLTFSG